MQLRFWDKVDPGDYRPFRDAYTRTTVALAARELGDEELARTFLSHVEHAQPRLEHEGALRYGGMSVYTSLSMLLARFGRANALRQLVTEGFPRAWQEGPVLADAAYPDVLVARAVADGAALDLVLQPGSGGRRVRLRLERLTPRASYLVEGGVDPVATADDAGMATVEVDLRGRREIRIRPQ